MENIHQQTKFLSIEERRFPCTRCGSVQKSKNGHTKSGTQRFLCTNCRKVFTIDNSKRQTYKTNLVQCLVRSLDAKACRVTDLTERFKISRQSFYKSRRKLSLMALEKFYTNSLPIDVINLICENQVVDKYKFRPEAMAKLPKSQREAIIRAILLK